MIFWLMAIGLVALVLLALLFAGWRGRQQSLAPENPELDVYRDQLAELGRDRARGLIAPDDAAAAETEIKRRMLSVADSSDAGDSGSSPAGGRSILWLVGVATLVPCAGVALYLTMGRPDLATGPVDQARGPSAADVRRAAAMSPQARARMIRGMVEGLEARLKDNPNDLAGWMRLGRAWAVLRQWAKAAAAYKQALRLQPKEARALEGFIAARLRSLPPRNPLPPDLRDAVSRLAKVRPGHPLALYFGGVIAAESRDFKGALAQWRTLLAKLPANSPLAPVLKRRIAALEKAMAAQKTRKEK